MRSDNHDVYTGGIVMRSQSVPKTFGARKSDFDHPKNIHDKGPSLYERALVAKLETAHVKIAELESLNQNILKASQVSDGPECPICMEDVSMERKPFTLSCGHSMCEVCLNGMSRLVCPECRHPFEKPTGPSWMMLHLISQISQQK